MKVFLLCLLILLVTSCFHREYSQEKLSYERVSLEFLARVYHNPLYRFFTNDDEFINCNNDFCLQMKELIKDYENRTKDKVLLCEMYTNAIYRSLFEPDFLFAMHGLCYHILLYNSKREFVEGYCYFKDY